MRRTYRGQECDEEWEEVSWGPYLVSDHGRMAVLREPWADGRGYVHVQVVRYDSGGKQKHMYVHQVVAEAFLGPLPEGCEIHHIDGDKTNNHAANLEYVTKANHVVISTAMGQVKRGEHHSNSKVTEEVVRDIRRRYRAGNVLQRELAEEYGIHQVTVGNIVRRVTWRHIE